jgi:predicted dehydrogenase
MPTIKLGIIRCDMHGMYYGALMAKHDPYQLQKPVEVGADTPYSWMTGGAHFYFYTFYSDPTRMTVPFLHEFEITRVWDENEAAGQAYSDVFPTHPKVCDSFDQVSDEVDLVLVADCNYDGSDHLELAAPGLEKGVPTFIDKPLSNNLETAKSILALADKHKAPLLSCSILGRLPQAKRFAARFPELGELEFVSIRGGGPTLAGQIHAISLAQNLFGTGVESVESMGENDRGFMHLNYPDAPNQPRCGTALNCDTGQTKHCAFSISAFGPQGAIHSDDMGDFEFPYGAHQIILSIKEMMDSGKSPISSNEMLENIAVATAASEAHRTGKRVSLADVGFEG